MSNKFTWEEYNLPKLVPTSSEEKQVQKDLWEEEEEEKTCNSSDDEKEQNSLKSFTIRHLKQGATGARKTWPAAEVLLDYLVRRGGLRSLPQKVNENTPSELNFMKEPSPELHIHHPHSSQESDKEPLRILELGGGTGYLSIGLALALNAEQDRDMKDDTPHSKNLNSSNARIVCTDNDKATIKNMKFNISNQPKECKMNKMIKVSDLDWANDVGGDKFDKELRMQFQPKTQNSSSTNEEQKDTEEEQDPLTLVSHLVASDVHYGKTTLEPLSSVIAATKLRNPQCRVTILCKERAEGQISDLKHRIEEKIQQNIDDTDSDSDDDFNHFYVSVRNIVHDEKENLKLIEC
ncbi:predicted protein [Chaetoceros tenuissimus]|uniref:Uncharacterized protein n=1 Tax=Chaetoceros tenuissimus TaxID=426638 RepID=A0AAD3HG58_9STRA|nr:predicted protein [Chaetoceros tenuissimus]